MGLLTSREVADIFHISYQALLRLIREERENCPPYVRIGKVVRFDEDEVKKWINEQMINNAR